MIYWLIRFVNAYRQYIILTILILFSLLFLSLNDSKDIANLRKASFIIYGLIDNLKSPIDEFIYYKKENEALKRENSELVQELTSLRRFEKTKDELKDLKIFNQLNSTRLLTAQVILKTNDANGNRFIIDKGFNDGVKVNAIVFNSRGLIGYVSDLSKNYSVVHTIANLNVRISVRNVRTKAFGILAFDGAKFKVYNVSKSDDVKEGDIFSTTEFSSQFPPDIPVIQVIYASRESEILFYDITGKPTADLNNVRYCLIGTNEFESNKIKFLTSDSEQ